MSSKGVAPAVSDADAEAYYTQHPAEFETPKRFRVAHVLVRVPPVGGSEAETKARAKVEDVIRRAREGEDFAKLAREYSEDTATAPQGGDLGSVGPGEMVPAFEQAAFALKKGRCRPLRCGPSSAITPSRPWRSRRVAAGRSARWRARSRTSWRRSEPTAGPRPAPRRSAEPSRPLPISGPRRASSGSSRGQPRSRGETRCPVSGAIRSSTRPCLAWPREASPHRSGSPTATRWRRFWRPCRPACRRSRTSRARCWRP